MSFKKLTPFRNALIFNRKYIPQVTARANADDKGYITSGVLCGVKYKFYQIMFFINQEGGRSGHTVNGTG